MSQSVHISFLSTARSLLYKRPVYHTLIWLLFTALNWIIDYLVDQSGNVPNAVYDALYTSIINTLFVLPIVYINYLYLMPKILVRKKFVMYLLALMLTCMLIMPIKLFFIYIFGSVQIKNMILVNQWVYYAKAFILAVGSTLLKITAEWIRQERIRQDLERENMQAELRFLRSQINPHFLFNTLNSLYALTLMKSDNASETVLRLSGMMRYMLYDSNEKEVSLEREIEYIQNYIELESMRYKNKSDIQFEITGVVNQVMVAPHLFINFVENSFKHGLHHHIGGGYIRIRLHADSQSTIFTVTNSKSEEMADRDSKGGIGLENTQKRLNYLYPNRYQLTIEDKPKEYTVTLKLQLTTI